LRGAARLMPRHAARHVVAVAHAFDDAMLPRWRRGCR
jgi:hypothetical protein